MLLKYGQKLTGAQRSRMELLCSQLSKLVDAACRELPETPRLSYYFQRWETESKWQNMCLAKLMIYSFLDIRVTGFQESLDRTRSAALAQLSGPYILFDVNSGGMSLRPPKPEEPSRICWTSWTKSPSRSNTAGRFIRSCAVFPRPFRN